MLVARKDTRPRDTSILLAMPPADVREVGNGRSRMTWDAEEEVQEDTQLAL